MKLDHPPPDPPPEVSPVPPLPLAIWYALLLMVVVWYGLNAVWDPLLHGSRNDFGHMLIGGFQAAWGGDLYSISEAMRVTAQYGISHFNPFVYPPFMALAMIPLSWFSYDAAWIFWSLIAHALVFSSGFLTRRILVHLRGGQDPWGGVPFWTVWIGLLGLYHPWIRSLDAGQFNAVILFGLVLALYWLLKEMPLRAGLVLGLLAGMKVAPILLILWLFVWGRPKAAVSGLCTFLGTALAGVLFCGWDNTLRFLRLTAQMSYGSTTWQEFNMAFHVDPANQAPSAVLYRLFTYNEKTLGVVDAPGWAYSLSVLVALFLLGLVAWKTWGRFTHRAFLLGTAAMLLLPSLFWDHYLVQWLPALVILGADVRRHSGVSLATYIVAMVLIALPFTLGAGAEPALLNYFHPLWASGWRVLVPAHKLLGFLLTFALLLRDAPLVREL